MTRKEKRDEAIKLKAAIENKKPKPEIKTLTEKQNDANMRRRKSHDKAKNAKGSKIFKEIDKSKWDFEKW
jgi:hypothetical protein